MSEQPIMLECSWVAEREAIGRGRVGEEWKVTLFDLQGNVFASTTLNDFQAFAFTNTTVAKGSFSGSPQSG